MPTTSTSRSVPIRFAVIAAVVILAAGCPSSSDEGDNSNVPPPALVEEPPAEPAVEAESPSAEPGRLPKVPAAEPIGEPDPAGADPAAEPDGPIRQTAAGPRILGNPLRNGNEPPLRDPVATGPKVRPGEPRLGKHSGEPFDPVKVNGPIFVGWPKPKLALVITGRQEGYLEPCGCAGLDRMKGGMSRRHTLLKYLRTKEGLPVAGELRGRGWPVVGIDVGGLAKGYGRQAEIKFHITVESMRKMGYEAIALGKTDLRLPAGELLYEMASGPLPGNTGQQNPFLSANVALFGFAAKMTPQTRIVEAAGIKLGITGVVGKQFQKEIRNDEIEMTDPDTALAEVVPDLKQKADYLILLAHATMEESIELGRKFPDFDLVVTAGGAPEPPAKPAPIEGSKALLIEVGEKGMDAIVLGMFADPKEPLRYQRVPLDSRFPGSGEMQKLMEIYQEQLKELGFAGLGIRAVSHPQKELGGKFVGSEECKSCHEESYRIWKKSGHAKAHTTLVELDPPRQFDPECISCHVIGWHPTEHYPYQTGYQGLQDTPRLIDVGCESCHGPGGAHVAAENGTDMALQEKLAKATVITKEEAADPRSGKQHCYICHDLDNSPDFDFETYWSDVEHYEDD